MNTTKQMFHHEMGPFGGLIEQVEPTNFMKVKHDFSECVIRNSIQINQETVSVSRINAYFDYISQL